MVYYSSLLPAPRLSLKKPKQCIQSPVVIFLYFVSKFCKECEVSSIKTRVVYLRNQRSLLQDSYSCFGKEPWETLPCCGSLQINRKIKWNETPDAAARKIRFSPKKKVCGGGTKIRTTTYINNLKYNSIPCCKQDTCMGVWHVAPSAPLG